MFVLSKCAFNFDHKIKKAEFLLPETIFHYGVSTLEEALRIGIAEVEMIAKEFPDAYCHVVEVKSGNKRVCDIQEDFISMDLNFFKSMLDREESSNALSA